MEPSKEASQRQRRANWVGLRTLRQRPKLVGATHDGEPIYEIRSVRLVLLGMSPVFNRVAQCSRCGRELPGAPVTSLADLDIELRPMICADCIRGTGITSVWDPEAARRAARGQESDGPGGGAEGAVELASSAVRAKQAPLSPQAEMAPATAPSPAPAAADAGSATGDRLGSIERHLEALTARVHELGRRSAAQQAQAEERRRREAEATAARDAAVDRNLAELRAERAPSTTADGDADVSGLEDRVNQALAELRAERARAVATEPGAEVSGLEVRLNQALAELGTAMAADLGADVRAREDRVNQALVEVVELGAAQRAYLDSVVAKLSELGAEVGRVAQATDELAQAHDSVEQRLEEAHGAAALARAMADLDHRLEAAFAGQRAGLEAAVDAAVDAAVEVRTVGLVRAKDALAGGQAVLDRRLEAVAGQLDGVVHRLEELTAWTGPAGDRIGELEKAIQQVLRSRPPRQASASPNGGREAPPPDDGPVEPAPPPGSFLERLDRQLEAASERLAARAHVEPDL